MRTRAVIRAGKNYYTYARPEVASKLHNLGPILDVGCGSGRLASSFVRAGFEVVGIEPYEEAAEEAARSYNHVHLGTFEDFEWSQRFAQVVFADVLEHMVDPWQALQRTREEFLKPGGRVVASIPNTRHWRVSLDLTLRGRWTYTEEGLLDATHLRFFTRREIRRLFEATGFVIESIEPKLGDRVSRLIPKKWERAAGELFAYQWIVVAQAS